MERIIGKILEKLRNLSKPMATSSYFLKKENLEHQRTIYVTQREALYSFSLEEFEKWMEVYFLDHLYFPNEWDFERVKKRSQKVFDGHGVEEKNLWLGAFFEKEIQSGHIPLVEIRWMSPGFGYGLFAKEILAPQQYMGEYTGMVRKRELRDRKNPYCFEYTIDDKKSSYLIDAQVMGNHTRFINHSDEPNLSPYAVFVEGIMHVIFVTNQTIGKGCELTYDYGPNYWKRREPPQETR
ncbi:MAG: SET domain-containing protein-lysine N-methyltransferase [Chlamydiota bacterium]